MVKEEGGGKGGGIRGVGLVVGEEEVMLGGWGGGWRRVKADYQRLGSKLTCR